MTPAPDTRPDYEDDRNFATALARGLSVLRAFRTDDDGLSNAQIAERTGLPQKVEDLAGHRLICQNPTTPQVQAGAVLAQALLSRHSPSTLLVNSYFGVLQGVLSHVGVGILPNYMEHEMPHLVRVLPDVESTEVPVFLAFPEELRSSRRVAAFRDFVLEEIQAMKRNSDES